MALDFGGMFGYGTDSKRTSGASTSSTKRNISQEGIDKIMSDILGSELGLASLATGENISGGSGSTVKTQLAQDLVTKLAGELAIANAETIATSSTAGYEKDKSMKGQLTGKAGTVICTELVNQDLLDPELYVAGSDHFASLHKRTVIGYQSWACPIVSLMKKYKWISLFFLPIAQARYLHITGRRKNLIGLLTVLIAQPICYIIGYLI